MNESGIKAAQKYDGIQWWLNDWATEEMSKRKYRYVVLVAKEATCFVYGYARSGITPPPPPSGDGHLATIPQWLVGPLFGGWDD